MAEYARAYPALEPLDDEPADVQAGAIASGDELDDQHMTEAELQYRHRKHLFEMGLGATSADVMIAKKRKLQIEAENTTNQPEAALNIQQQLGQILGAINNPTTGLTALGNRMTALDNRMTALDNRMAARMTALDNRLQKEEARNLNRFSIRQNSDRIIRVPNDNGDVPDVVWFPEDVTALIEARLTQLNALINFYGLDGNGDIRAKRERLRVFLGIPI